MLTAADRPPRTGEAGARLRPPADPSRAEHERGTKLDSIDATTDAELGRKARAGDRLAFAGLYERFAPAVGALVRQLIDGGPLAASGVSLARVRVT